MSINATCYFENGKPVLAVSPVYPNDEGDAQDAPDHQAEALEALQAGLLVILNDGHRDGATVRVGALAYLCGLFDSPASAAGAIRVNRSTMTRAVQKLRSKIARSLCNAKKMDSANEKKQSAAAR